MDNAMISTIRDLPSWFNLSNYDFLEGLNEKDLLLETLIRTRLLEGSRAEKKIFTEFGNAKLEDGESSFLRITKLFFSQRKDEHHKANANDPVMSLWDDLEKTFPELGPKDPCTILNLWDISTFQLAIPEMVSHANLEQQYGKDELLNDTFELAVPTFYADRFYGIYPTHNERPAFWVSLDIHNYTDKQILSSLKKKLEIFRNYDDVKQPKSTEPRSDDIDKILKYKLIQYFDLMYWSKLNQVRIKKHVVTIALWPDGEKGTDELKQTIEPLFKKIFSTRYFKGRELLK
jgi:hypothetical protein